MVAREFSKSSGCSSFKSYEAWHQRPRGAIGPSASNPRATPPPAPRQPRTRQSRETVQPAPASEPNPFLAKSNSSWLPRNFMNSFGANLCKNPKTRRTSAAAPPLGRHALLHKAAPRGLPRARPLRPVRSLLGRAWGLPMIRGAGAASGGWPLGAAFVSGLSPSEDTRQETLVLRGAIIAS